MTPQQQADAALTAWQLQRLAGIPVESRRLPANDQDGFTQECVMERPILVLCECCQSEGRIYTSDGGPYEIDHGECPICKGRGDVFVECEPITMEDLDR